jgi:hypothetical protein
LPRSAASELRLPARRGFVVNLLERSLAGGFFAPHLHLVSVHPLHVAPLVFKITLEGAGC